MLKSMIKRLIYKEKSSSKTYVNYLRRGGAKVGDDVFFFSPRTTTIDPVRLSWIKIGNNVKFSSGVSILAHDYSFSVLLDKYCEILQPGGNYTVFGNNIFLGRNATILSGVTVGDNVIIGANSVVTKDVPSNTVIAGSPARPIMTIDEYYNKKKSEFLDNAIRNIKHEYMLHDNKIEDIDFDSFSLLFLERTDSNYEWFSSHMSFPGCNKDSIKKAFYGTSPIMSKEELIEIVK